MWVASDSFVLASVNLGFRSKELDRDQGDQVMSVHRGNAVLGGTRGSSKTRVRYFTDMQVNLLTDSSPPTPASYIAIVQLLFHLCGNIAFAWALWEKQRLWFPVSTRLTPNLSTHSLTQTTPKTRVTRINSSQNIETCFTGLKSTFHCLRRCYGHFSSFCYYYYMTMTIIFTPASFGAG